MQSGKTANFIINSKTVDAGYKLIIILAGIHNVLRKQTQVRLDQELTGMDDLNLAKSGKIFIEEPSDIKDGLGLLMQVHLMKEFIMPQKTHLTHWQKKNPIIAVIKKNVTVLVQL